MDKRDPCIEASPQVTYKGLGIPLPMHEHGFFS